MNSADSLIKTNASPPLEIMELNQPHYFEQLTSKGWAEVDNWFPIEISKSLQNNFESMSYEQFKTAKIGNSGYEKLRQDIRKSSIAWINNWNETPDLITLKTYLADFQKQVSRNFFLSLKHFESQYSFYEKGGFYKKHKDQLKLTRARQLTLIIYLSDCTDGGELVIYNRDNINEIDKIVRPKQGKMVCFFSKDIFHEVLPTNSKRYAITTWYRDDDPVLAL